MPNCPKGTNPVGNLCVSKPITNRDIKRSTESLKRVGGKIDGPANFADSKQAARMCAAKGMRLPYILEVYMLSQSRSEHASFIKASKCGFGESCLWQTTSGVRSGLWKYARGVKFVSTYFGGDVQSADTGVFCVKNAK